jgi:hypothetical protein
MDFLKQTNGWPDPIDDVPMGFRLDFAGIPIYPLPTYDCSEVAPDFKELVKQASRWSIPCLTIWKELKLTRKLLPVRPVRAWTILWKGLIDSFSWIHYLLHILCLVVLLFITKEMSFGLVSLVCIYLDAGIGTWLMLKELSNFQQDVLWRYRPLPWYQRMILIAARDINEAADKWLPATSCARMYSSGSANPR